MEPNQTTQKSNGALMGSVVIIIILIIGGIYLWKSSMKKAPVQENTNTSAAVDSTSTLDANVNSIDLDSLDKGL